MSIARRAGLVASVIGVVLTCGGRSDAEIMIYTDPAAFQAVLAPGSYLETFSSLTPDTYYPSPLSFSSGGFSYKILGDPMFGLESGNRPPFIGNVSGGKSTVVNITSGNVTAISLDAFTTNLRNQPDHGPITVTVDGTASITFAISSTASFVGFTDTDPINSLVVSTNIPTEFTDLGNLTVGTALAVPEPSSLALCGIAGLIGLGVAKIRRKRAAVA